MTPRPILIEGWRFIPHSYGMLNHWQILELLRRPEVSLYMRDTPMFAPHWKPLRGLMRPEQEDAVGGVPAPPPDMPMASTLRITIPLRFKPAEHGRTFVLGTADFGWLPRIMIENGQSLRAAHAGTDVVILSPSHWSKWGLLRGGADPKRVSVVHLGVDPAIFRPASADERRRFREENGWQDKFFFLNVSAMAFSKGTDLILKAFARVAARHDHVWLLLKGTDHIYASHSMLNRFWNRGLTSEERQICRSRLLYIGKTMSVDALADIYRAADAYVTPYRSEAFNLPALEAAACGLPLICTSGGPTDEFTTAEFAHRIRAALVPRSDREPEELQRKPDLDELTDAMSALVESASLRESARIAGPRHVHAAFTWKHTVDKLLRLMLD
jgi:glycosyltransferase involved in cell wall biosynthesis